MRNVLDKSCTENQNTRFIFSNFSPQIAPFMRQCRKIWSQRGHKWRHNMAHTSNMLDKQGYTYARTGKYIILIAFPRQHWFRARVSILRSHTLPILLKNVKLKIMRCYFTSCRQSCISFETGWRCEWGEEVKESIYSQLTWMYIAYFYLPSCKTNFFKNSS
jgi:hypothetical protein